MPYYVYLCETCGRMDEFYRRVNQRDGEQKCQTCGTIMERLPSTPSLKFIGDGWGNKEE
jgi:putative FmdB family regulatory protein